MKSRQSFVSNSSSSSFVIFNKSKHDMRISDALEVDIWSDITLRPGSNVVDLCSNDAEIVANRFDLFDENDYANTMFASIRMAGE